MDINVISPICLKSNKKSIHGTNTGGHEVYFDCKINKGRFEPLFKDSLLLKFTLFGLAAWLLVKRKYRSDSNLQFAFEPRNSKHCPDCPYSSSIKSKPLD